MKKLFICASAFVGLLTLSGCGAGTSKNSLTGLNTGNLNTAAIGSALSTVITELMKGQTSAADIVGTWTYSGPKIVFESENLLNQLGSAVASSKLESMLSKQLDKIGLDAGKSQLTLKSDKTYTFVMSKKTYTGTYTYDASTKKLVMQGSLGLSTLTCTATINGNQLHMLFDADKLLTFATGIAGSSSNLSTISSLLKAYNGLKLGWAMTR